jgi:hypothetical protein
MNVVTSRYLGFWMAVALLGCGKPQAPAAVATAGAGAGAEPTTLPPPVSSAEAAKPVERKHDKRVALALKEVEITRGLKAKREVPGITLSRTEMLAKVRAHVDREVPEKAIEREGLTLKLLGLLPEDLDYKTTMFKLLEEELAGFYEPDDGTMYLAADLPAELAKMTLYHELVHALQDHAWDLKAHGKYKAGESDHSFARSALAEGDATSAMLDPMLAAAGDMKSYDLPGDMFEAMMAQGLEKKGSTMPVILRKSLVAPYVMGLRFVSTLRKEGGWKAVDAAWANPPTTSEQLLHVEKWKAHEPEQKVKTPTAATLTDFAQVDEDTSGEASLRIMYDMLGLDGTKLAGHWGGDRSAFFEKGSERALAMRVQFDRGSGPGFRGQGRDRLQALTKAYATKLKQAASVTSETFVCFERGSTGPLSFAQKGDELWISSGPTKLEGTTFTTASTCPNAKRWAEENGY